MKNDLLLEICSYKILSIGAQRMLTQTTIIVLRLSKSFFVFPMTTVRFYMKQLGTASFYIVSSYSNVWFDNTRNTSTYSLENRFLPRTKRSTHLVTPNATSAS